VLARADGKTGSANLLVRVESALPVLMTLQVQPSPVTLEVGRQLLLQATGSYSDGSTADVTALASWRSSDPGVIDLHASAGKAQLSALRTGVARVSATVGTVTGEGEVTVIDARLTAITVSPAVHSLVRGVTSPFTAVASFSDGSTRDVSAEAAWASSDPTVVLVSNGPPVRGLVTAVGEGTAMVSASLLGVMGAATVSVSPPPLLRLAIDPELPTVPGGVDAVFRARGLFSDGSSQDVTAEVAWESSDPAVAAPLTAPTQRGRFSTPAPGSAMIRARLGQAVASTTLTVGPATLSVLAVAPAQPRLPVGLTQQLRATGVYSDNSAHDLTEQAVWSSTVPAAATVSDSAGARGLVTAVAVGSSSVAASFGGAMAATNVTAITATRTSLIILPDGVRLARGSGLPLRAVAGYSDGVERDLTDQLTWLSSAPRVAAVTSGPPVRGWLRAVSVGSATITAGAASASVTVSDAELISVAVTPSPLRLARGTALGLRALGTYSDGSVQDLTALAFWGSLQPMLATVGNAPGREGLVTALGEGTAMVTATVGAHGGSGSVVVTTARLSSLGLQPSTAQAKVGSTVPFRALGGFSDDTTQDISDRVLWTSSNPAVADISNGVGSRGLAVALAPGESTITARFADVDTSSTLTVVP
jgi:uncharacterized protein YjdB